jgi:hypothetical protein
MARNEKEVEEGHYRKIKEKNTKCIGEVEI